MEKFMSVFRVADKIYKFICFALVGALGLLSLCLYTNYSLQTSRFKCVTAMT